MEDHGLDDIKWPALSFGSPNSSMTRYDSAAALGSLSPTALRSVAELRQHFVVDSTVIRFDLSNPEFSESVSKLQTAISSILGSRHCVRWKCARQGSIGTDELKRLIEEDWRAYATMWQALDLDDLKRRLSAAKTIPDVIAVFG